MSWTDQELADRIEELLDEATTTRLDANLAQDPDLAERAAALTRLLAEPVTLPPIPLPDALAERVRGDATTLLDAFDQLLAEPVTLPPIEPPADLRQRVHTALEEAGLLFDVDALSEPDHEHHDPVELPAGLLGKTLGRLEQEGLVAAAPELRLVAGGGGGEPTPASGGWRRLAAAILIGLGLGLATHALRSDTAPAASGDPTALAALEQRLSDADAELQSARRTKSELRADMARLREEAGSLREARRQATSTSTQLAAQVARLNLEARAALDAKARLQGERDSLAKRAARAAVLEQQVAQLQAQVDARPKTKPGAEERVTQLERLLAKLGKELQADRKKLHQLDAASRRRRGEPMEITRAQRIEVWVGGAWVAVSGKRRLEAGTILRGHGATNALVVGVRPYRLRDGALYRVKGSRRLELLPTTDDLTSGGGESPDERVPDLIRQLAAGTPSHRARAYEALVELYWFYRDLDPGLGVVRVNNVAAVARGRLGEIAGEDGPPALDEAKWWAWWTRIKSHLGER